MLDILSVIVNAVEMCDQSMRKQIMRIKISRFCGYGKLFDHINSQQPTHWWLLNRFGRNRFVCIGYKWNVWIAFEWVEAKSGCWCLYHLNIFQTKFEYSSNDSNRCVFVFVLARQHFRRQILEIRDKFWEIVYGVFFFRMKRQLAYIHISNGEQLNMF